MMEKNMLVYLCSVPIWLCRNNEDYGELGIVEDLYEVPIEASQPLMPATNAEESRANSVTLVIPTRK